jgi:hypothetical protein
MTLANRVMDILDEDNVAYFFDEETGEILFGEGKISSAIKRLHFMINVRHDSIIARAVSVIHADPDDEDQLYRLMRFLSIINWQIEDGNFQVDTRDGEIQFRLYRESKSEDDDWKETVHDVIVRPSVLFDRYLYGMILSMSGFMKAQDAAELCEQGFAEDACGIETDEPDDCDFEDDTDDDREEAAEITEEEEENPYDYFVYGSRGS